MHTISKNILIALAIVAGVTVLSSAAEARTHYRAFPFGYRGNAYGYGPPSSVRRSLPRGFPRALREYDAWQRDRQLVGIGD
jgi:hypothetical protein